jgi:hypothetical protein
MPGTLKQPCSRNEGVHAQPNSHRSGSLVLHIKNGIVSPVVNGWAN